MSIPYNNGENYDEPVHEMGYSIFRRTHVSRWKSTIFGIGNRNCHGSICWQCWAVCIWRLVVFTRVDVYHGNTYCICIYILYNIVETQYIIYYIYIFKCTYISWIHITRYTSRSTWKSLTPPGLPTPPWLRRGGATRDSGTSRFGSASWETGLGTVELL